jgi:transposase
MIPARFAGDQMRHFVEGADRGQVALFPDCLEDWIGEDNPVRVIDVFVDELDLAELGFGGVEPEATGRPSYHPSILLKLYIYGYLNRVQSSRRLEREAARNIEVMWLTGPLVPDQLSAFTVCLAGANPTSSRRHTTPWPPSRPSRASAATPRS